MRQALQRFPTPMVGKALRLAVEHDRVVIEWAGGDVDPAPIDAAHAILREVCRVTDRMPRLDGDDTLAVSAPLPSR